MTNLEICITHHLLYREEPTCDRRRDLNNNLLVVLCGRTRKAPKPVVRAEVTGSGHSFLANSDFEIPNFSYKTTYT